MFCHREKSLGLLSTQQNEKSTQKTVTVDMEVMTLKGVYVFKQDKHSSKKGFIPWIKENIPPPAFPKRVRETQTNIPKSP